MEGLLLNVQKQQDYNEYIREVRAKQFGWKIEEPTPLSESVAKPVTSKTNDKTKKETKATRNSAKKEQGEK